MESTKVETLQAIERHQGRLATVLQYKSMFEMAKAMGDNNEAAKVMQMMKDYNRAHPPEASSSASTAPSSVPTEVQTLSPAAQTEETLTESNQNSKAV
jgi:hypothetical protein